MEAKVYLYAWLDDYGGKETTRIAVATHDGMEAKGWLLLDTQMVTFNAPPMVEIEARFAATKAERDAKRVAELKAELAKLERPA